MTTRAEDDDTPPGEEASEAYHATVAKRAGGARQFLWFVTKDGKSDNIFQIADIRRIEPPADPANEVAFIHFSGVTVGLHGVNLRRIIFRITMGRCDAVYEYRPGQAKPEPGEPIVYAMKFADMTKATRKNGPED